MTFDYGDRAVSARKVLLVDDSALVRSVIAHTLGAAGFAITVIDHPKALADAVSKDAPDLLLVDASYPGLGDDAFVGFVAPVAAAHRVVLFSDRSDAECAALSARIGARGYVPKDGATLASRLEPYFG